VKEKLDCLRNNKFLEVKSWGGFSVMPGYNGFIITNDKMIYYYHSYHHIPSYLKDEIPLEFISEGEKINDDIYIKLLDYIKRNISGKKFNIISIFDAGYSVSGCDFNISNHYDIYNDLKKIVGGKL